MRSAAGQHCARLVVVVLFLWTAATCAGIRRFPDIPRELRQPPGALLDDENDATPKGILRTLPSQGIRLTKTAEGWEPRLYDDAPGYCTIGYGHLIKRQRCNGSEPAEFLHGIREP